MGLIGDLIVMFLRMSGARSIKELNDAEIDREMNMHISVFTRSMVELRDFPYKPFMLEILRSMHPASKLPDELRTNLGMHMREYWQREYDAKYPPPKDGEEDKR